MIKKIIISTLLLLSVLSGVSSQSISKLEYWYDGDFDGRVTISMGASISIPLNIKSLSYGLHYLHYRVKDLNGKYSAIESSMFYYCPNEKKDNILTYWFDDDAGDAKTVNTANQTDGAFRIDGRKLSYGQHTLHYCVKNGTLNSSPVYSHRFINYASTKVKTVMPVKIRYWLDGATDKIQETAIDASEYTEGIVSKTILHPMAEGNHKLSYQILDNTGNWSGIVNVEFIYKNYVKEHEVTFNVPTNGTLVVKRGALTITSGSIFPEGTVLTLVARPDAGYKLASLTANGSPIENNEVTIMSKTNIQALFTIVKHAVTFAQPATGGMLKVFGGGGAEIQSGTEVEHGTQLRVEVTLDENYVLKALTANGADIMATKTVTVTDAVEIAARVENTSGITDITADRHITLSPNPARLSVTIELAAGLQAERIEITDLSGRTVYSAPVTARTMSVKVSGFAKGVYLVRAGNATKKLIVE